MVHIGKVLQSKAVDRGTSLSLNRRQVDMEKWFTIRQRGTEWQFVLDQLPPTDRKIVRKGTIRIWRDREVSKVGLVVGLAVGAFTRLLR